MHGVGRMIASMQIQYELTFQDFRAAQSLHAKRSAFPYFAHVACFLLYPFLGILGLLFTFTTAKWRHDHMFKDVLLLGGSAILILLPVYMLWIWRRLYRRTRSGSGNCNLNFGPDLIRTQAEHSRSEVEWPAIKRFTEDEKLFLLYLAPARFLVIPKRVCSAEHIEELRALFQSKIAPVAEK